ncbi:IS1182 family transposase [Exiguobacterium alkaliphilum]|uniref:IS1182 family transposase n=1 Tax=Exiguobacterium alkaliphilum TaxID=1428684 RepID=UPI000A7EA812|nr:IS1182 family transposase [Exiguobacterium alkaliphilum]
MYKEYTMNQLVLPLDLEVRLPENDIAFAVHDLVEQIPDEAFETFWRTTGCPAYHPRMMMKIVLCAYTQSVFSGRKIEGLLKDSLRMMWLAQGHEPSYRTINRFRVHPAVAPILKSAFVTFRCHLVEAGEIDQEAIFIDGTKLEANANRYTFVWRKAVEKYSAALVEKSNRLYEELMSEQVIPEIERESPEALSVEELEEVAARLGEKVDAIDEEIASTTDVEERKRLRARRKEPRRLRKQASDFAARKRRYEEHMAAFGTRNSYSKTDRDATFMRMKDDHMKNGQLKPGYNVQIATSGQYTLAYDVFPNPTDMRTLAPFLDEVETFLELPAYIVADAGYGSQPNYTDILERRGRVPLIPYTMYRKEQKKKWRENPFNISNWAYDRESDAFTCPDGRRLPFSHESRKTDRDGFVRESRMYLSEDCGGCPFRDLCTKAEEGSHRQVGVNVAWEEQKHMTRTLLSDEKTGALYARRKTDVEPVFGYLKANLGFTRFSVRGKQRVRRELGFALMAVNLRKFIATVVARSTKKGSGHRKSVTGPLFLIEIL